MSILLILYNTFFSFIDLKIKGVNIDTLAMIDWDSVVTAFSTLILVILTGVYVVLTKRILDSQSEPCIVVTAIHESDCPTIIQLVIRNVGSGLARDIHFELSRPIPVKAWGVTIEEAKIADKMEKGPLIDGIPGLGPREERRIDWGQYGGLYKALGEETVYITSHFRKGNKKMQPIVSAVDIKSFSGTNASESIHMQIAKSIASISTNLEHLTKGFKKLHITIVEKAESADN